MAAIPGDVDLSGSSCRVGQCGTCATRVLAGEVEMDVEEGLDSGLREQGYRL